MTLFQFLILLGIPVFLYASENSSEKFYEYVEDQIEAAQNYVLPTENVEVLNVTDNFKYDFGFYDFIIIGAGAGGSILANRLSEIGHWKILLLEAGGEQTEFSYIPGFSGYLTNSQMNWGYYSSPQTTACVGWVNASCEEARGKVLGGSTVLDFKMHIRGHRKDYDYWASLGNEGWSYDEVLPYFIQMENNHIPNEDVGYHGHSGELDVSYTEPSPWTDIQIDAVKEIGLNVVDVNGKNQIGISQVPFNLRGIKSLSGATAFLENIRHIRNNLKIEVRAFVTKILINGLTRTASGVEFIKNGKRYVAKATKEVILSAGSLNTPQILMLSGIGPRDELDRHGIKTILDLPVGKNLVDHFVFNGLAFKTNATAYNDTLRTWLRDYLQGHRPLTANFYLDTCTFFNSVDEYNSEANCELVSIVSPGFSYPPSEVYGSKLKVFTDNFNPTSDVFFFLFLTKPKSKGTVTLKSSSPADFPVIDANFLSDAAGEDLNSLYRAVLKTLTLLDTNSYKAVNGTLAPIIAGCDDYEEHSREWWYCAFRNYASSGYHPIGTARMGVSVNDSVVNPELLVHGMRNLRVVDASVMPDVPSGNTAVPTFMIGNKISHHIKEYYRVHEPFLWSYTESSYPLSN